MPRIRPIEQTEAPPEAHPFYDKDVERYGTVLNNTKVYAHNVDVLKAIKGFVAAFADAKTIPLDQKALIRVHVAGLNGCPF
jgi:alkylhydroperoxidase family enzyme